MIPVIDLHADTFNKKDILKTFPYLEEFYNPEQKNLYLDYLCRSDITLENRKKGNVRVQTQSLFLNERCIETPLHGAMNMVATIKKSIKSSKDRYQFNTLNDMNSNPDKYGTLISIEGLEVIENDLDLLDIFYELGVRLIAPTWNRALPYVGSCVDSYGIQSKGIELAKELNTMKVIFDVSHMSETGFWDYMKILDIPVIASHSNYMKVNSHVRNLNKEQMKAIAEQNGVVGLNFFPGFMEPDNGKDYQIYKDYPKGFSIMYHMLDEIISDFGDNIVAFGSDFDGIQCFLEGVENPSFYQEFASFLKSRNVSNETIDKLFYKNASRVLHFLG